MVDVCLIHNQLAVDGGKWYQLPHEESVMDIIIDLQLPACLSPDCPLCQEKKAEIDEIWNRR